MGKNEPGDIKPSFLNRDRERARRKKNLQNLKELPKKSGEANAKVKKKTPAKKPPLSLEEINRRHENQVATRNSGTSNEVGKKLNKKGYKPDIPY